MEEIGDCSVVCSKSFLWRLGDSRGDMWKFSRWSIEVPWSKHVDFWLWNSWVTKAACQTACGYCLLLSESRWKKKKSYNPNWNKHSIKKVQHIRTWKAQWHHFIDKLLLESFYYSSICLRLTFPFNQFILLRNILLLGFFFCNDHKATAFHLRQYIRKRIVSWAGISVALKNRERSLTRGKEKRLIERRRVESSERSL